MNPWDLHPALVHFPFALLIAATVLDLASLARPREIFTRCAAGLYIAGVVSGLAAGAAGVVAFLTAPMVTDPGIAFELHPAAALAGVTAFTFVAVVRWQRRLVPPRAAHAAVAILGVALLSVAGWLGHHNVTRHGVGVTIEGPHKGETPVKHPGREEGLP